MNLLASIRKYKVFLRIVLQILVSFVVPLYTTSHCPFSQFIATVIWLATRYVAAVCCNKEMQRQSLVTNYSWAIKAS